MFLLAHAFSSCFSHLKYQNIPDGYVIVSYQVPGILPGTYQKSMVLIACKSRVAFRGLSDSGFPRMIFASTSRSFECESYRDDVVKLFAIYLYLYIGVKSTESAWRG